MKKNKILVFLMVALLITGFTAASCAAPAPAPAPAPEKPSVIWQLIAAGHSPEDTQQIPYIKLADAVRARTDGKFDIKVTSEGELGITRDGFAPALSNSIIDGCMMANGFAETTYPHIGVLNLPYLFSSADEARKGQTAIRPISEREYAKDGIMILADHVWVAQEMFVDQKVEDVTNLKGLKIRGWSAIMNQWIELAGGVPLSMPSGEVYMAVQRGVANGGITGSASAISAAYYEVAPYAHLIHFFYVITDVAVSQASFNTLPKEYQDILLEEGKNFTENFKVQLEEEDASAWDIWKSKGGEVIELTPAQASALKSMSTSLWDSWLEKTTPEGKEAFEAVKKALGI